MEHVDSVVVGGGIAGLTAAWRLKQAGKTPLLLEASDRCGGLIHTKTHNQYRIEFGPDAFITRKPWAYDLALELGLQDRFIRPRKTRQRIYILRDGSFHAMPQGLNLLVPTNPTAFRESGLLSEEGSSRALAENTVPALSPVTEESMASFVSRRFGREHYERIAEPLLAGVYNGNAEKLSMQATFPQYPALEQKSGSLITGLGQRSTPTNPQIPPLLSFQEGMETLSRALIKVLDPHITYNSPVASITPHDDGFLLTTATGKITTDKVVVTTSAAVASRLLASYADLANSLAKIPYEGVGSLSCIYPSSAISSELDAYGVVIPAIEHRQIDGMQWTTSKWDHRAPAGQTIIRVFFGGPNTRQMLDKSPSQIRQIVQQELEELLAITATPEQVFQHTWNRAYPQYHLGHQQLVVRIRSLLPAGLALAGNSYQGVGIPDTIHSASIAVEQVLSQN